MNKFYCILVLFLVTQLSTLAQDINTKIREIGLSISGNTFGASYKGGNESTLARLSLFSITGSTSKHTSTTDSKSNTNAYGLGFSVGFEKRKNIAENFYLYLGSDLINSYQGHNYKTTNSSDNNHGDSYSTGLGFVFGFHYKINNTINVSSEIVPNISYTYEKTSADYNGTIIESKNSGFYYGLNNYAINLTISFTLLKNKI